METITLTVSDGTELQAYAARPSGTPAKGIIVIQEAFGVTEYIKRMTERFTAQGFLAIAPEFFHRTLPPGAELSYADFPSVAPHFQALTTEGVEADLKAAYDWLVGQGVPAERIAALGFCFGGRASFIANTSLPLACAVSFYGGGIDQLLDRVPRLSGPQLFFWGGQDKNIPKEKTDAVADALRAAGKTFVEKTFPNADHAFARDVGDHYDAEASKEAWAMADAFLGEHLP